MDPMFAPVKTGAVEDSNDQSMNLWSNNVCSRASYYFKPLIMDTW